jgi:sarcosine oxidase delta subunit
MGVDASTGQYIVNDESFSSRSEYPRRNGWIQRNSVNSHNWFGAIANLKTELAENLTLDVGFDSRFYKGLHYRNVRDLLGSDGYRDSRYNGAPNTSGVVAATKEYQWPIGDVWNVFGDTDAEEKIDRNNNGVIDYFGLYFQLEYLMDDISIFVQGSGSNKGYQREEFYLYANGDPLQYSEKTNIAGGTIKAGANWNIDAQNNLFANAGYFSKQPNLNTVFQNYDQIATPDDELFNEKIVGLELGYGFRSRTFDFNVNLYSTTWTDRFLFENVTINGERGEATFSGVKQVHTGLEFDGVWQLSPFVELSGMFTIGDYAYAGDVTDNAVTTNESNVVIGSATLYLDDAKVGDTAHSTAYLDLTVSPSDRFKFNLDLFHADKLYGSVNAEDFDEPGRTNMRMPSYEIFGAGASYRFPMGKDYVYLRLNVNNLFDEEYYQESGNNYLPTDRDGVTYKGINIDNRVVPGWGRTWNLGLTYRF